MKKFANVLIFSNTRQTDKIFTYQLADPIKELARPGILCNLKFGRGDRLHKAVIIEIFQEPVPEFETKEIVELLDEEVPLSEEGLALAYFMVNEYLSDMTSAIKSLLPPGPIGAYKAKYEYFLTPNEKADQIQIPKNAIRQQALLDLIRDKGVISRSEALKMAKASWQTLRSLVDKGYVKEIHKRVARRANKQVEKKYEKQKLTEDQRKVYDKIKSKIGSYLLCGVTGSGKTEIYLQLVEDCLKENKEAICLVPEISLTPQTIARFEGRFGPQVAILHSGLSNEERYEEWEKIINGRVSIAIGARSAIFAPFKNLGLIIIDEEHETSYSSEKNPKYKAYDIAKFRANWHNCSLLLASATPSVESFYRAEKGELVRLDLRKRVLNRPMPETFIMDMRSELKRNNRTMFSVDLYKAIKESLNNKEQVILFLNKRGHTSYVFCRSCGFVYRCDACDVAMTYHKHRDKLICHYCGREKAYRKICPECGSDQIKEFGAGTEQLEEETRRFFPNARIARADADTMQAKGAYDRIYKRMLSGDIDILLGTQMIAKGFDFPKVSVVGIMAADLSLNLPDLRAAERTFQLISQVAGRSGRGNVPGRVYIQSYKPDNYAIRAAADHDPDSFYKEEIEYRKENSYPPFFEELHILVSAKNRSVSLDKTKQIRAFIDKYGDKNLIVDGPGPNIIERLNGRYRFSILIRTEDHEEMLDLGRAILKKFPPSEEIWIVLSTNPSSLY